MKKLTPRDLENLALQSAAPKKKIPAIGLDLGEKFCGLAWSPDGVVALPIEAVPIENLDAALERAREKFEEKNPVLVVGLPVSGDGSENLWCQEIRKIAKNLAKKFTIELVDERGSSQAVLFSAENKSDRAERIDDLAAVKILEFWLQKSGDNLPEASKVRV
ncbi:Holliday junction resolvase RuvX [bacterium]|jgi:putative transcription antitermination factor YqgF|nr:Holliday junction resolvase RuvX [bacterium]MBT6831930.1 Holliday junction resolvase RuvX [bacterium]MBT6996626.1 Holliday junction resolvase RuvX [bacterium]MBT7773046.1 Holliday junction resolvase RuvX [bacterium]